MNLRDCLRTNFAAGLVGSLGAACLGVFFAISPFGHSLVHLSYDIPFLLRSDIKVDGAVIVYMDEESRRLLGQPTQGPWDRSLHVRLLDELGARGAKAVVFDVLFDQPSTNRALDEVFAMAIRSHGRVVLAASAQYYVTEGKPSRLSIIRAVDPIGSAAPWGIVELPQ